MFTDTAPFTFTILNSAFEHVQSELTAVGDETFVAETWLIGLPAVTTVDPEARLIVSDSGSAISYPSGSGGSNQAQPQLPVDLSVPLKLWERQNGTGNFVMPMFQANSGLANMAQQTFLVDWEWKADGLIFRGALQVQDVKLKYQKLLAKLAAPTDPVPIRGVVNAAAYFGAKLFCASRGGAVIPQFEKDAMDEIFLLKAISARRRQRKQIRRAPYSGRDRQKQSPI